MKSHLYKFMLGMFLMMAARPLCADTIINFETNPSLPAQPNNFAAAGAMQTYTQAGVYSLRAVSSSVTPRFSRHSRLTGVLPMPTVPPTLAV